MRNIVIIQGSIITVLLTTLLWRGFDCTEAPWDTQHSYPDHTFFQYHAIVPNDLPIIKYILFSEVPAEVVEIHGKSRCWPKPSPDFLKVRVGGNKIMSIPFSKPLIKVIHIDRAGEVHLYEWEATQDEFKAFFQPFANPKVDSVSTVLQAFFEKQSKNIKVMANKRLHSRPGYPVAIYRRCRCASLPVVL